MQAQFPSLPQIPALVRVKSGTELNRYLVANRAALLKAGTFWVRTTAGTKKDEILAAGNPGNFVEQINGVRGRGFHAGSINQATNSARVQWIGRDLAAVANLIHQTLIGVIWQTFPKMRRHKQLTQWQWYLCKDSLYMVGPRRPPRPLGAVVPANEVELTDVLLLAPSQAAADFAWFANRPSNQRNAKHNAYTRKRHGKMETKIRKRVRGFVAEAARQMRSAHGARGLNAGISIQGRIVSYGLTASASRAVRVPNVNGHAIPIFRLAYQRGLNLSVTV